MFTRIIRNKAHSASSSLISDSFSIFLLFSFYLLRVPWYQLGLRCCKNQLIFIKNQFNRYSRPDNNSTTVRPVRPSMTSPRPRRWTWARSPMC